MITYHDLEGLGGAVRAAVINLLYRLGDDELIIGHRSAESVELFPVGDDRTAFSSIAQDEISHAGLYYEMLHRLGEPSPEALTFARGPREFRCASLASLPPNRDRESCVLRQFLYDTAETVRLAALCASTLAPLAQLAGGLRGVENSHLAHGRRWVLQLADASHNSRERMQKALDDLYPHALGLFEPTEADEPLAQTGICPREDELRRQWESAVAPVIAEAALDLAETVRPVYGGRVGRHAQTLGELLERVRRRKAVDVSAKQSG
jgi:ring-1,2-phenylacetyl-CoA epoxidase subunit PaaC